MIALIGLTGCITDTMWEKACDRDGDGAISNQSECPDKFPSSNIDCDDSNNQIAAVVTAYQDGDNDGFGGVVEFTGCPADVPGGYVDTNGDCDDTNMTVHPDADEYACDDIDSNCNSSLTDGSKDTWYADLDNDGYGNPDSTLEDCDQPTGHVDNDGDCNDGDATINPDAEEDCIGGVDDDCNGIVDDGPDSTTWYTDSDNDSFGDPDNPVAVCDDSVPEGTVSDNTDCDDTDPNVNPDAAEVCGNEVDDNCNDIIDDDAVDSTWFADTDNDGFGDVDNTTEDCAPPDGYTADNTDCDDADNSIHPDAEEVCFDGVDNNCNDDPDDCLLQGTYAAADADIIINGAEADLGAGEKLQSLGDIDGDGNSDLLVAAPSSGSGYGFIFYGPISSGDTTTAGRTFEGDGSGELGAWSSAVGDVDDDGTNDLIVVSPGAHEVYAYLGPVSAGSTDLAYNNSDSILSASDGDYPVATTICDFDNDGDDDLIVGAHRESTGGTNAGAVFIHEGPFDEDATLGTSMFYGDAGDYLGADVTCGDVSGDGIPDMIVGADQENDNGAVHLIYGPPPGSGDQDMATYADLSLPGETSGDYAGWSVEFIGDFDGDGNGDFVVGAYKEDTGGTDAGAAYLFHSAAGVDLGDADSKLIGDAGDEAGFSLAGNCDVNGDGYDDLIVGAIREDDAASNAGAAYLMYGLATGLSSSASLDSVADAKFTGDASDDRFGMAVECMRDLDGYDNVVIGSRYYSDFAWYAGGVFFFQGTTY